jgi:hypothetical protein
MLANALDGLGHYDEAAHYFQGISGRLAQKLVVAEGVSHDNRDVSASNVDNLTIRRNHPPELPADPVFLLAWPGSGWEWLVAGLGAHPQLMLVADQPQTQVQRRAIISQPAGAKALSMMSQDATLKSVQSYWQDLKSGGLEPGQRMTLDAMWISADMLPTLKVLFPKARFIKVNRDAGDLVMEWFKAGYSGLDDMSRAWRDEQSVIEAYRDTLNLEFTEVDGAQLLQQPEQVLKEVTEALGLEWDDAVLQQMKAIAPARGDAGGSWSDYAAFLQAPLAIINDEQSAAATEGES